MKLRFASLTLAAALVFALPAVANLLYTNGPYNGTIGSANISDGYAVSNSFTLRSNSTLVGFDGVFWVHPGDTPVSTSWNITQGAPSFMGGSIVAGGGSLATFHNFLFCRSCVFGFDLYRSVFDFPNVALPPGTYYIELFNAVTNTGREMRWDENNGPSAAYGTYQGLDIAPVYSDAFSISGIGIGPPPTPEPGTLLLLGSGAVGLAGMLRRKINQ